MDTSHWVCKSWSYFQMKLYISVTNSSQFLLYGWWNKSSESCACLSAIYFRKQDFSISYRSTVRQTRFHVEQTNGPQRNNLAFQILHFKSPSMPLVNVTVTSLTVRVVSIIINEHNKSVELCKNALLRYGAFTPAIFSTIAWTFCVNNFCVHTCLVFVLFWVRLHGLIITDFLLFTCPKFSSECSHMPLLLFVLCGHQNVCMVPSLDIVLTWSG